jgi:hypothetical protein
MNTKIRFLVLNSANEAQKPACHGYHGPDQQGDKSPSFLSEAAAKGFGDFLAKRYVGERFYLAQVVAATVQYTDPAPAGTWAATTATGE